MAFEVKIKTWQIEMFTVASILFAVFALTSKSYIELFGVFGVILSFGHTQISDRLQEEEEVRNKANEKTVECHKKLIWYFAGKEISWFCYFVFTKSYPALIGVVLFLLYPFWRKYWRVISPKEKDDKQF